jgi:tetratricopeptide (TPR) repeat protein
MASQSAEGAGARAREQERHAEELIVAGDGRGSVVFLDQAIALTLDADDPALAPAGRRVLQRKADVLSAMGEHQAALAEYDRLVAAIEHAPQPEHAQLAEALNMRAISLSALMRSDDAVSAFQAVTERFCDDADRRARAAAASAAFNRATVIRDMGRAADALAAFGDVARRYGDDPAPDVQEWTAIALFNQAGLLAETGRPGEALDLYQEVTARFAQSPSAMARERAAGAAFFRAQYLAETGRAEEARAGLAELERAFGGDQDPRIREIAGQARVRLVPRKPVPHALDDPMARSVDKEMYENLARTTLKMIALAIAALAAIAVTLLLLPAGLAIRVLGAAVVAAAAVAMELRWQQHRKMVISNITELRKNIMARAETQARDHASAQEVISDFDATGQPYALYLRSFDIEAMPGTTAHGEMLRASIPATSRRLEAALATGLEGRVAVVGLQNPSDDSVSQAAAIPKFALPGDGWQKSFEQLVAGAEFIVIVPVTLSPGISAEIAGVLRSPRVADTVVIVPGATADHVAETAALTTILGGAESSRGERLDTTSPELAGFARVVPEDEVAFDALDSHPLFADLLERVAFLAALPPEQRRQARDARLSRDDAVRRAGSGDQLNTLPQLHNARHVQERLGDRAGRIATLLAIGSFTFQAGDVAGAAEVLQDALARCGERDIVVTGPILYLLGSCQEAAGDLDGALSSLGRAVEALTAAGSRRGLAAALLSLGQLLITRGEPESSLDPLARAAALAREAQDNAGQAWALSSQAAALLAAGREPEAATALRESVEIIEAAPGDPALAEYEPLLLALLAAALQRIGEDAEAQRYAAAARARPASADIADQVERTLAAVEAGRHRLG